MKLDDLSFETSIFFLSYSQKSGTSQMGQGNVKIPNYVQNAARLLWRQNYEVVVQNLCFYFPKQNINEGLRRECFGFNLYYAIISNSSNINSTIINQVIIQLFIF